MAEQVENHPENTESQTPQIQPDPETLQSPQEAPDSSDEMQANIPGRFTLKENPTSEVTSHIRKLRPLAQSFPKQKLNFQLDPEEK